MKRVAFTFAAIAMAVAAAACVPADKPAQEQTSDSMQMMNDSAMMSDTMHVMAGDTAQRM